LAATVAPETQEIVKLTLKSKASALAAGIVVTWLAAVGLLERPRLERDILNIVREQQQALAETVAEDLADKLETHLKVLEQSATLLSPATLLDAAARQDFLHRVSAARQLFDSLGITSADGEVIAIEPSQLPPTRFSIRDRDYFQRLLATGQSVVSPPLQPRSGTGATVLMLAPVRNAEGRLIATVAGTLHLQRANVLGQLAQSPVGRTGHFEIVTTVGTPVYVVHPDADKLLAPAAPASADSTDVVTTRPVRGVDWELRAVLPAAEAAAPVQDALRRLLGQLLVLGVAIAACIWLAMHWLLRPLSALQTAIHELRESPGAELRLPTEGDDELAEVTREFEALVHDSRRRQAELEAVMGASPLGIFRAGLDGQTNYVNDAYLQQFGVARHDAARGWLERMHPAAREEFWHAWCAAVRQRAPVRKVIQIRHPDGRKAMLSVRSAPLVIDGQLEGHVGTIADITERVEAEKHLQRQTATLRSVAEAIPAFVAVVGPDLRYRFVNLAFENWFGIQRERIVGRAMIDVLGPHEFARSRPWAERVLAGETINFEKHFPHRPSASHLSISYVPLWLNDGTQDGFVSIGQDITRHKQEAVRLLQLSQRDTLTGLLNRAGFEDFLERVLGDGGGPTLALLYVDLDHFKAVNDEHGHAAGDQLLKAFAQRLRTLVRPTDAVARLGGDEFAVVLPGVRQRGNAQAVADKVIAAAKQPFDIGPIRVTVGASVGVAFGVDPAVGWHDLLTRADTMLYQAKQGGRGRQAGALH
jgi:diguanylate cyclase (GGDEF)-like protein/PAS domain S-box-containing protein